MDVHKLRRRYLANKELMARNVMTPTTKMKDLIEAIDTHLDELAKQSATGQVDTTTLKTCDGLNERFINEVIRVGALRENADRREKMNHQAYEDVVRCSEPRWPNDTQYMAFYNSWRPMQQFSGDDDVITDDDRPI